MQKHPYLLISRLFRCIAFFSVLFVDCLSNHSLTVELSDSAAKAGNGCTLSKTKQQIKASKP